MRSQRTFELVGRWKAKDAPGADIVVEP